MTELVRDRLLSGIACSDINPADEDAYERVDKELTRIDNGTASSPWRTLRPDNPRYIAEAAPIPCADLQNRWHYVVTI